MSSAEPIINVENLTYAYSRGAEAVHGLSLTVQPGRCYGLFGRNGAGKTTTIKCMLNLLRPQRGTVRVFGMDSATKETPIKRRLAYVPDQIAFYPWMSVQETFDYLASFREHWNRKIEQDLLGRFQLDGGKPTAALSKGQRTQVALIAAICPEPDLLLLDEPTSGLDPIVRREFIETVIGAYQEGNPGNRTIVVSTHLITEFEGLIDEFTIMDGGRSVMSLEADVARDRYRKIRARFSDVPPDFSLDGALQVRRNGRELELIVNGAAADLLKRIQQHNPVAVSQEALTLEEIFVAALKVSL
jgi:ABC-2 type transport system ATP-binding protein